MEVQAQKSQGSIVLRRRGALEIDAIVRELTPMLEMGRRNAGTMAAIAGD